jgi:uncharacterized protein (DUF362 family)
MSYILDPPALFLLGILLYNLSKRLGWDGRVTVLVGAFVAFILFMGGSTLLYLDIVDWPIPWTEGPVWMFHTNYTGIDKADVPLSLAVFMLLLYPGWLTLGYTVQLRRDEGFFLYPKVTREDVKSRGWEREETQFTVRRGPSPSTIVKEAIDDLGGIGNFVKEGDRVIVKPNICGGNPQIPGSFTSIEVVDQIVAMIREAGAEAVVVDSDMIWTKFDPVAERQGWKEWATKKGVTLVNLAKTKKARFDFGIGSATKIVPVSKELVEADVIISVPTMKTHILTSVTMGMKNMYGTFPEEAKAKYHRKGIEEVIYEVNWAFTPNLTLIDGTIGGEGYGPLSCSPVGFQTVVASNDVVAADAVACRLMGYDPMSIKHIKRAHDEGLGDAAVEFDLSSLPQPSPKDGDWELPDPKVSVFYESLVELSLMLPGMQVFFDLAADFVLYGMATIPVLKDLTPEMERIFNDIFSMLLASGYGGERGDGDVLSLVDIVNRRLSSRDGAYRG